MKRVLCFLLCVCCIFFTGCNSILYGGNLHFEAYPPATLPDDLDLAISGQVDSASEVDMEKYNLEGTDAFYILPQHCDVPEQMIDFEVLDYTSDGRFVYAYITPYLESGTEDPSKAKNMVTVLMSYQPYTGQYKIFFSKTDPLDAELSLNVHKLGNTEEYFIFYNQAAWVYDKSGTEIYYYDVSELILSEVANVSEAKAQGKKLDVVISAAVMDQMHYLYIPLTFQVVEGETTEDDLEEMSEDEFESTVYQYILVCYSLDIGGRNADIVFYSDNLAWEAQKALWSQPKIFASKEAMEAYQKDASLERIKAGKYGSCPDNFDVFNTRDSFINLELAGIPDLNSFTISMTNGKSTVSTKTMSKSDFRELFSWYFVRSNISVKYSAESSSKLDFNVKTLERAHWEVMTALAKGPSP